MREAGTHQLCEKLQVPCVLIRVCNDLRQRIVHRAQGTCCASGKLLLRVLKLRQFVEIGVDDGGQALVDTGQGVS